MIDMSVFNRLEKKLRSGALLTVLYGLCSLPAGAAVLNINASFAPDSAAPHRNEFKNQTPSQGFCTQVPQACEPEGLFSLIAPIAFTANAPIRANHADPRQGGMAKVPSEWRDVQVTHSSGETHIVKIRIAGIGHESAIPVPISELTGQDGLRGWDSLWQGGGWIYAPSPCQGVGWATAGTRGYNSFWKVPRGAGVCAKQALLEIPLSFRYLYFVFGYQLITPNPLSMQSGQYTGSITFSVGPGQDFDTGDVMQPDDSTLTLNFNLDVQHTLKVDIPPGGNKVELVPEGGWQNWLQNGRKPVRLFRDQTFNISASSRFKMELSCFITGTNNCMIVDLVSGRTAEVQISISLPNGLTDLVGEPVKRRRFYSGSHRAQQFQPAFYVDRAPGVLHFEIDSFYVNSMLQSGRAATYSGTVTVIWDSEV